MSIKTQIAIDTKEHSLIELHEKITALLQSQPLESRKLFEQLIDYYNKIILCMPGNVYWMDRDCRTISCNQNVLNMFGLANQKQFYDLSFTDMARIGNWSKKQGDSFERDTRAVINSGLPKTNVEEPPIPAINGELIYFLSTRVPLYNTANEVIGIVGISTDITKQKLTEIALEKANRVKTEFLANLSHDLRTPLSSLTSLTEQLTNRIQDPELNKLAFEAQSCAEQVMLLIDEILEITEIDLGPISKQEKIFNLDDLVEAVFDLLRTTAVQKGLTINFEIDKQIPQNLIGKSLLLHRVLLNLLSNAIKFTHKGQIDLSAKLIHQQNNIVTIEIKISDTGIGIPKDKYTQIFEQFERLSSAYEGIYEGRGLGLYIVKQFIAELSGEISLDSIEQQGTTFIVTVPLSVISENDENKTIKQFHPNRKNHTLIPVEQNAINVAKEANLLLIEDTEIAKKVAVMILEKLTSKIDVAIDGKTAIQKAINNSYDLILLDIGLPDMSGIDVAKRIREFEQASSRFPVPIIALTAHLSQSSIQTCLNAGIQQVIMKPLSLTRTMALFENWLDESFIIKNNPENKAVPQEPVKIIENEIERELLKQLPENRNKIVAAYATQNRATLRDAVHYLHGPTCYTKMKSLQKACNSLESAIIDNFSQEEIDELYQDLLDEIQSVLEIDGSYS